jgi:predicted dehydrogenase
MESQQPMNSIIQERVPRPPAGLSRRKFIHSLAAVTAATGLPVWFAEQEQARAATPTGSTSLNDRPTVALIGCGRRGVSVAKDALRLADVVAVCDVDRSHAESAAKELARGGKQPDTSNDFRPLLERKDVQLVINGTPDHWHTLINIAAARAGKDIYCEKPLTLTVDEGRHLVKVVRENQTVLQTGTQQRSDRYFRLACELVRNERIGKLKEIIVWLPAGLRGGPFAPKSIPPELNWDFWQGQSPATDYMPERGHTTFRYWLDYAGGTTTDWGAHHNDIAFWATGAKGPISVEGKGLVQPVPGGYTAFSEYEVLFTYANGVRHFLKTTRDDNIFGSVINPDGQRNGIRFVGSDGWIWVRRGAIEASDEDLISTPLPAGAERLYASADHMGNFIECTRSCRAPICDVETGHRSATECHLANIALRLGRELEWNADREQFIGEGAAEANGLLAREMRQPYSYEMVGG